MLTPVLLSLLLPSLVGWLLVQRICPATSRTLRFGLGLAAGAALAGTLYFVLLLLSDSARFTIVMTETLLGGAVVFFLSTRRRPLVPEIGSEESPSRIVTWIFGITAIIAGTAFFFALDLFPEG